MEIQIGKPGSRNKKEIWVDVERLENQKVEK